MLKDEIMTYLFCTLLEKFLFIPKMMALQHFSADVIDQMIAFKCTNVYTSPSASRNGIPIIAREGDAVQQFSHCSRTDPCLVRKRPSIHRGSHSFETAMCSAWEESSKHWYNPSSRRDRNVPGPTIVLCPSLPAARQAAYLQKAFHLV